MLTNKIKDKFFSRFTSTQEIIERLEVLDALIGGSEIIGIEERVVADDKYGEIYPVVIYFRNANKEELALSIYSSITDDNKPDTVVLLSKPDIDEG